MGLDVQSDRGQQAERNAEMAIQAIIRQARPGLEYATTPKTGAGRLDGVFIRSGVIERVVEVKCRNATERTFMDFWGGRWLVTYQKLLHGKRAAEWLGVPFVGVLFLVPSGVVYILEIANQWGEWSLEFDVQSSNTKQTCNTERVVTRWNAYLPMANATKIKV